MYLYFSHDLVLQYSVISPHHHNESKFGIKISSIFVNGTRYICNTVETPYIKLNTFQKLNKIQYKLHEYFEGIFTNIIQGIARKLIQLLSSAFVLIKFNFDTS